MHVRVCVHACVQVRGEITWRWSLIDFHAKAKQIMLQRAHGYFLFMFLLFDNLWNIFRYFITFLQYVAMLLHFYNICVENNINEEIHG